MDVCDLVTIQKDTLFGRDYCFDDIDEIGSANWNIICYTMTSVLNRLFLNEFLYIISSSKILIIEV